MFSKPPFQLIKTVFFLLPVFFLVQTVSSQPPSPTPPTPTDVTNLDSKAPVERTMSGTPRHTYLITLATNQYIKIGLEQRGIDVGGRLYGTDGKQIMDVDSEMRVNKPETIEFVAPAEGTYRLDIINRFPNSPAGKYEIKIIEMHPATEKEILQQQARNLYAESIRLRNAGKNAEAQQAIEKAIEINKKELGTENLTFVLNLNHFAKLLTAQGNYEQSIEVCRESLAHGEKALEADHPAIGMILDCLASGYKSIQDYPKSVDYYQKSLALWQKSLGEDNPTVAVGLINLGGAYRDLGDRVKSIEFFEKALAIQEKFDRVETYNTAVVLVNLGLSYTNEKAYTKAESQLLRAIAILEKLYPPTHPSIFEALSGLAYSYSEMQKLDKAEELYLRILSGREKNLGANHPLTAFTALNLANIHARRNDLAKAEPLYRRALKIREEKFGENNPVVSEVLSELVLLLAQKNEVEPALQLQQRVNAISEQHLSLNLTIGSERQKLAFVNEFINLIDQNVYLHTKFAPENQLAAELAVTTILRQKGRVLDAASNNFEALRRRSDPQDRLLLDNFNKLTSEISELIISGPGTKSAAEHQLEIKALTDKREKLEDEISRRAAGFFPKSEPVTRQAIQKLIPADAALLEFAVYNSASFTGANAPDERRYIVYILQNSGDVKWKDLGPAKQIDTAIYDLRKALREKNRKDVKQLARTVDEKIMQPVRELLGSRQKIFVSPDGELNLIPFEALVDEKNRYLIENYSFNYLTSGRDLLRMQAVRESKNKPLILANPSFGEPSAGQFAKISAEERKRSVTAGNNLAETYFAPLGATMLEGRSIKELFPEAELLSGAEATETIIKQSAAPRILHVATHGFFLQNNDSREVAENPLLRSGLALTGANQRQSGTDNDGILTALEASGLNLWGTKLVVLSACDTGLGDVKNGEGVYGLRRAFTLAGAETLMMSLWEVSDVVTRELMTNYYKNLRDGMGRGEALREVQLQMLKKNGREHPFYWAAFIQSGEWADLKGKR